jgi:hypothetical protein
MGGKTLAEVPGALESRSKVVPEMKVSNIEPQMSQPLGPTIPKMFTYTS